MRIDKTCLSLNEGNARGLHQCLNTCRELTDNFILATDGLGKVERNFADSYAVTGRLTDIFEHLGTAAQALRRNAAFIETGSANGPPFDNDRIQARTGRTYRSFIASGTRSDNDKISILHDTNPCR